MLVQNGTATLSPHETLWLLSLLPWDSGGCCCNNPIEEQQSVPITLEGGTIRAGANATCKFTDQRGGGGDSTEQLPVCPRKKTLKCFTPEICHNPPSPFTTLHLLDVEKFDQGIFYHTLFFLTGPCVIFPSGSPLGSQGTSSCILLAVLQSPDLCQE